MGQLRAARSYFSHHLDLSTVYISMSTFIVEKSGFIMSRQTTHGYQSRINIDSVATL